MSVNGTVLMTPALNVNLSKDTVTVDGVSINSQASSRGPRTPSMFVVHKLPGELVTRHDPAGRPTVFSRVEAMGLPKNLIAVVRWGIRRCAIWLAHLPAGHKGQRADAWVAAAGPSGLQV